MYWPLAHALVLAVHPTVSGFGWVLFARPDVPLDWGVAYARTDCHAGIVNRFARLLSKHGPSVLVMEQFAGNGANRAFRIRRLCRAFERVARAGGIDAHVYDRTAAATLLGVPEGASRHEIAKAIASRLDAFRDKLPPKRAFGDAEATRQSLFNAAAVAFAHFASRGVSLPPVHSGAPE